MKKINSLVINTNTLAETTASRSFIVKGEDGAEASLQVYNSSGQFYNFLTGDFSAGFNTENNLVVKMEGKTYTDSVVFPANVSADTFSFLLLAAPDKDTELQLGGGRNAHITSISRIANQALTFTPISTDNDDSYQEFASTGAESEGDTESPTVPAFATKTINWEVKK